MEKVGQFVDRVVGVVWDIDMKHTKNLDGYEALHKDYNRIPVVVKVKNKVLTCFTYVLDPAFELKDIHKKPTKGYINTVATGYSEHGVPLEQIKKALLRV